MKKILFSILFSLIINFGYSQSFSATSISVTTASPDSCTTIDVVVNTFLGCINWTQGPATYTVNGSTINLDVNYTSSFICAGAISNPIFNLSLTSIPSGSYSLVATAYLDNVQTNTITGNNLVVASCSTVGLNEHSADLIEMYPNPVVDVVTIKSSITKSFEISVYDIKGSLVKDVQFTAKGDLSTFNVSELKSGIYFVQFKNNQEVFVKKLIKK